MCDQDIEMGKIEKLSLFTSLHFIFILEDDYEGSNKNMDNTWFGCDLSEIFYGLDKWSLNVN